MTRALLIAAALVGSAIGAHPAAARADVQWLCRPGIAANPCEGDQTTTYYAPDGSSRTGTPAVPARPPVDCFYVYPTVSNQPTTNATKSPDPEVKSIAAYQAQRFSTRCRVFAPLYREVTAAGVSAASQTHDTKPYDTALADVREAWAQYLKQDNHGRGVILIGHSQGSRMLRALIRRDIDPRPAVRDLLVSAIIPGANVTVAKGRRVGGDFAHVPACDSRAQIGCVIAYSTFNEPPPDNTRFGRTDTDPVGGALDLPTDPGSEVLCTDPTALSGSDGRLESLSPSEPFAPGIISALLVKLYRGPPPSAPTPWLEPADHYTARCEASNGANVLMIAPVGAARKLDPSPDATWGVHLVDVNIALGNLLTITAAETTAWQRAHLPLRATLRVRRLRSGARRLTVRVTGPAGRSGRLYLQRGHRTVARRAITLAGGRAVRRFTVPARGRYRAVVRLSPLR